MKKIIVGISAVLCLGVMGAALTACSTGGETHTHDFVATTVQPTCGQNGLTVYKCSCGENYLIELPATGAHIWGEGEVTTQPTCEEMGVKTYTCTICQTETKIESIAALAHDIEAHSAKAPTCTDIGWEAYATCQREGCTYTTYEELPIMGGAHVWGEGKVTLQPTCTEKGEMTYTCTVCKTGSKTENIPATLGQHNWKTVTTPATCQAQGYDTKTCIACGEIEMENYTPVVDHAWEKVYSYDSSYHWYACSTCEEGKGKQEHTDNGRGVCSVCEYLLGATEGIVYEIINGAARVVKYEGTATKIRIADVYDGVSVTEISNYAFEDSDNLVSVIIPDSVTIIGNSAFASCDKLKNLIIPDSVTIIGRSAFAGSGLTDVTIGNAVTTIGDEAFYNCNNLRSLIIPDNVTMLGATVCFSCDNLENLVIGNGVTAIQSQSFTYCDDLENVVIGDSVVSIGDRAFESCNSLTSVVIPDSVTTISGFQYCSSLRSVELSNNITSISAYTFSGCKMLSYNEYGNTKYLGNEGNPYLVLMENDRQSHSSYEIHPDTKVIAHCAFKDCDYVTSIVIPASVTNIGEEAFYDCGNLTEIEYNATECADFSSSNYVFNKAGQNGEGITVRIGANVKKIPTYMFYSNSSLSYPPKIVNVIFEEGSVCESIGNYAFCNSDSLVSVEIPDSVTSIGEGAFRDCESLISVVIGESVTSIGEYAFIYCESLTSVVIGDGVTSIGESVFKYCNSLANVYYKGSASEWLEISIGSNNYSLNNAMRYYYSESQPTTSGNYWHYDENGEIAVW